jgi:hypothetical protein
MREVVKRKDAGFWVPALRAHTANDTANLPTAADFDRVMGEYGVRHSLTHSLRTIHVKYRS